jgi:hypothetical protein
MTSRALVFSTSHAAAPSNDTPWHDACHGMTHHGATNDITMPSLTPSRSLSSQHHQHHTRHQHHHTTITTPPSITTHWRAALLRRRHPPTWIPKRKA